jgi:hypothetical protein
MTQWSSVRPEHETTGAWRGWYNRGHRLASERVDQPTDLVAFALATGGHCGLFALGRPRIASGAPEGKTGCIATEQECLALPCAADTARPSSMGPLATLDHVKPIGDQVGLLRGLAQIVEHGGERMRMRRDAKAVGDQVLHHRRSPAARGIALSLGASGEQAGQLASLGCGQRAGATWRARGRYAGQGLPEKAVPEIAYSIVAQPQPRSLFLAAHGLGQSAERVDALPLLPSVAGIGLLRTMRELLGCEGTEG